MLDPETILAACFDHVRHTSSRQKASIEARREPHSWYGEDAWSRARFIWAAQVPPAAIQANRRKKVSGALSFRHGAANLTSNIFSPATAPLSAATRTLWALAHLTAQRTTHMIRSHSDLQNQHGRTACTSARGQEAKGSQYVFEIGPSVGMHRCLCFQLARRVTHFLIQLYRHLCFKSFAEDTAGATYGASASASSIMSRLPCG